MRLSRFFASVVFGVFAVALGGGVVTDVPRPAAAYVAQALDANLGLQREALDLARAQARLVEVRSALQPRLDLVARYSVADGGRTIDFPTGELLNPIHGTLNEYLATTGRPAAFPSIENQSIALLREREQETKLRLVQPLYRPQLARGIRAQRAAVESRAAAFAAYRRELRYSVLAAYYTYLQAEAAVDILRAASDVTAEAVRVNRLLRESDRVTEDRVLRAESEDLAVQQQLAEALRDRRSAQSFVNFLLNRPLDTTVELPEEAELQQLTARLSALDASVADWTVDHREEMAALRAAVVAASAREAVVRADRQPALALAVEGGIQGESYRTGSGAGFVQASVVAELNLWDGKERRSRVDQARLERESVELQLEQTQDELALALQRAVDEFVAARIAYQAASRRRDSAARAFELVTAREREGLANQLTFLDARAEATRAALNHHLTRVRLLTAAAAIDRAAALTPLP